MLTKLVYSGNPEQGHKEVAGGGRMPGRQEEPGARKKKKEGSGGKGEERQEGRKAVVYGWRAGWLVGWMELGKRKPKPNPNGKKEGSETCGQEG